MERKKRLKSFRVKKQTPLQQAWHVFDQYISLFIIPLFVFIRAVIWIQTGDAVGFEGLIAGIWILFAIISAIITGIFFVINKYVLGWRLNWWRNLLLSAGIFLLGSFIFGWIIRITS